MGRTPNENRSDSMYPNNQAYCDSLDMLLAWEYKRVLFCVADTIGPGKKYDKKGAQINPNKADYVEEIFNRLGSEGWEIATAVNLDSGIDSPRAPADGVIEYVFKRKK